MPSRLIREGILTSDRVEQLDFAAEVFYRRLMSKVDDHGLYDARPSVLRSSLYPLRVDRVREADCSRWIAACEKAGLIALYEHGGKPYLQMLDTRWTARSEPKYPLPTDGGSAPLSASENTCKQPETPVPVFGVVVDVVDEGDKASRKRSPKPDGFIPPDWINRAHWDAWHSCPKRKKATDDQKRLAVQKLDAWRQAGEDHAGALENAAVGGWQGLFLPDKGKANPADAKTTTVPAKPGRDPTLVRLEQEALAATKPPPEIRERLAQLTRGAA